MCMFRSSGIRKKLLAASKLKDCEAIQPWISSICNHLYWAAVSTPQGQGDLILDKWMSVKDHVQNHHAGFDGLFPECSHEQLVGRETQKQWLQPSKFKLLHDVIHSFLMHTSVNLIILHIILVLGCAQVWKFHMFAAQPRCVPNPGRYQLH
jgi:hypothetical protein